MDSVEREGTTFTLYLSPMYAKDYPEPVDNGEDDLTDGNGLCVLLVQDDQQVSEPPAGRSKSSDTTTAFRR